MTGTRYTAGNGEDVLRAILTDSHFWVPFVVLGLGVALLLHLV
ncbi:MAG: translocated intimin receptor Tir [Acidobacteriaceae bacterium]